MVSRLRYPGWRGIAGETSSALGEVVVVAGAISTLPSSASPCGMACREQFRACLRLTRLPVGAFIGNAMQNTENARRFVHLARTSTISSLNPMGCVAEQERSEILGRLEACLNSQAGSPDLRQRGDYLRHLSYLRNEQCLSLTRLPKSLLRRPKAAAASSNAAFSLFLPKPHRFVGLGAQPPEEEVGGVGGGNQG